MKRKETRESGFWHMRDSQARYIAAFVSERSLSWVDPEWKCLRSEGNTYDGGR